MGDLVEHFGRQLRELTESLAEISSVDRQRAWVEDLLAHASLESSVLAPFVDRYAPSLGDLLARTLSGHERMLGLFERQEALPLAEWLEEAGSALDAHRSGLERDLLPALEQKLTGSQQRLLTVQANGWRTRQRPPR